MRDEYEMKMLMGFVKLIFFVAMTTNVRASMLNETNVSAGFSDRNFLKSEFRHFWYGSGTTWTEFELNEESTAVSGMAGFRGRPVINGVLTYGEILVGGKYVRGFDVEDDTFGVVRVSAGVSLDGYKNYVEIKGDKNFTHKTSDGSLQVGFDLLDQRNYGLHSYQFGVFKIFGPNYLGIYIGMGI